MSMSVPFVDLARRYRALKPDILEAVQTTFESGVYILGDAVEQFEAEMSDYLACPHVLSVANGTDALIMALKALNIGMGDEVIVPVNSFIASAASVSMVGAKPVFCDVALDFNMDISKISTLVTDKTKAIMPVHLTGKPVQINPMRELCNKHGLLIIEDAAQSIGAKLNGQATGTMGDIGCFSLHPLKNLSVLGDGGIMVVRDKEHYQYLKHLRNHGLRDRDTCLFWGMNSRLDAVQARIASIGLRHLDSWTDRHRSIAGLYREALQNQVIVPMEEEGCFAVYHNFVILTSRRDELQSYLMEQGIETKIHYPIPLHRQPAAQSLGYTLGDFPNAERFANEMLSLPIYPELEDREILYVIEKIQDFFKGVWKW